MHGGLRSEIVDRDYQLLQLAAAVIPADEFIVRLIHKLGLIEFTRYSLFRLFILILKESTYRVFLTSPFTA